MRKLDTEKELATGNPLDLQLEIVQLAFEKVDCELNKALAKGRFGHVVVSTCGSVEFQDISVSNNDCYPYRPKW